MSEPTKYIIRWAWSNGAKCYVRDSKSFPYTTIPSLAKQWKTRQAAERYLSLKDARWAGNCIIEEVAP